MQARFKTFSSTYMSWEALFAAAAQFATEVGPDRLIAISHSHGGADIGGSGVVTVWYWSDESLENASFHQD
jgi:hypothetical protein